MTALSKSKLKTYAPAARRDFIRAVTERAAYLGLSKDQIEPTEVKGEIALIGGRAFPKGIVPQRERLEKRIGEEGFDLVMESVAYTWFNRMLALRYMELHGYLDHGFRVLSHPNGGHIPEILEQAAHVELPGLNHDQVVEMKLDGTKDAELYRMLFIAQCNVLHQAMPFLFEAIQDETELLLPDNLLHTNSLIQKLVKGIPEEDWREVEIIGWIYQFYISEKKDQVIGKVVKSEDIPAATQLFTPNWIVKYMVQNSLGRQWLATYPKSSLKEKMEFYIEPAEQTEEVQKQLEAITPKELNPEEITLLDPACGSGHILVEAYDVLKEIYLERGYRSRDIPGLILKKNLYGLEICDRAAQMAGFALMMKARADDPKILKDPPRLNVLAIQNIEEIDAEEVSKHLLKEKVYKLLEEEDLFPETLPQQVLSVQQSPEVSKEDIKSLLDLFRQAETFGSLISIPEDVSAKLRVMSQLVEERLTDGDLFAQDFASIFQPIIKQAALLAGKYDNVVANPPYMGSKYLNPDLKAFAKETFPKNSDVFSMFMERSLNLSKSSGYLGFVTPFVWMFISSFEKFRSFIISETTISSLIQLEYNAFEPACVPVSTFTLINSPLLDLKGNFIKLSEFKGHQNQAPKTLEAIKNKACGWRYKASSNDFKKIPGSPIAYWASDQIKKIFQEGIPLKQIADPRQGLATSNNDKFIRFWFEPSLRKIGFGIGSNEQAKISKLKWFPYNKGGDFRKFYGNNDHLINWENDGAQLKQFERAVLRNKSYYFKSGVTWTLLSSSYFGCRMVESGFLFDVNGMTMFCKEPFTEQLMLAFISSQVCREMLKVLNPTLAFQVGDINRLPVIPNKFTEISAPVENTCSKAVKMAKMDWDGYETSWDFTVFSLLHSDYHQPTLEATYAKLRDYWVEMTLKMQRLEQENNRIFIDAYGLQDELTPEVPLNEITLTCNPHHRYGGDKNEEELEDLLLADTMTELISYSLGCMMGRYSLDQPGLVYAHSGNEGFDHSKNKTFPADDDGIVPITDLDWFPDDATNRFVEFVKFVWSPDTLEGNLRFVANNLSPKKGEIPRETIRRYFSTQFFKDHLKTYKKHPIYWLFSSGKERAFQCLVYLHRYNESTLSRMRNEYVIPLQGKLTSRVEHLDQEAQSATSTSQQNKIRKQLEAVKKKHQELTRFDEELRHYADKRLHLDLDDGVKINYQKFGNLLAEVKTVSGKKE